MALGIQSGADVTSASWTSPSMRLWPGKVSRIPNLKQIAITLRGVQERLAQRLSACLHDGENFPGEPAYETRTSWTGGMSRLIRAGLIYGLLNLAGPREALEFAVAGPRA